MNSFNISTKKGWVDRLFLLSVVISFLVFVLFINHAVAQEAPTGLLVDLMPTGWPAPSTSSPSFSWIVNDNAPNVIQTAWRIQICRDALCNQILQDSDWVQDHNSTAVNWPKASLAPGGYFWRVATENNGRRGPFSQPAAFTSGQNAFCIPSPPLQIRRNAPVRMAKISPGRYFFDFGNVAFAALELNINAKGSFNVLAGELANGRKHVWRHGDAGISGGGSDVGSFAVSMETQGRTPPYRVDFPIRDRPTPAQLPDGIKGIAPFRYLEISGLVEEPTLGQVTRLEVGVPFNPEASYFYSDNVLLTDIYDLCKRTVDATTYGGIYVDGERERLPYEADAYINQLAHYAIDREFTTARSTLAYFMKNATWPTEWVLLTPLIALADYQHTGDARFAKVFFSTLSAKTLSSLARSDGLLSTTGDVSSTVLDAIGFHGKKLKDLVDWPPEIRPDYVMAPVNTVVNAYYYASQRAMAQLARIVGRPREAEAFEAGAQQTAESMHKMLFDAKVGLYRDGLDVDHYSPQASLFPLAFGLTPPEYRDRAASYLVEKGMFVSPYAARFLLEALYQAGKDQEALELLTSEGPRSWWHMLDREATITWEDWDFSYKPGMDLNHAWAVGPAEIITTRLMGVTPLAPGFAVISITPHPGALRQAAITVPTIRGPIMVSFVRGPGASFSLDFSIPANTKAVVTLPTFQGNGERHVFLDDVEVPATIVQERYVLPSIGSGTHKARIQLAADGPPQ